MENAKLINKELEKKYGIDFARRPMYRIVQNINLPEKRFIEIDGNKVMTELPKYNYLPEGVWILEKLFYTSNPELAMNYSYEPVYAFLDPKTGGYQAPNLNATIFVVECSLKGPQKILSEMEEQNKEARLFFEMLGGKADLADAIHGDSAISMSGLDAPDQIKGKN